MNNHRLKGGGCSLDSDYSLMVVAMANQMKSNPDPCTRFFLLQARLTEPVPRWRVSCRGGFHRFVLRRVSFR